MSNWKPVESSTRQIVGQVKRCANDNKVSHYDRSKIINTYNLNEHIIRLYLLIR